MLRTDHALIGWECQQLLNRVTNLIDNRQWEALAECYLEDGVLYRPSDPDNGIKGREAILKSLQARPPGTTCHLLANTEFEFSAATRVVARSRVWLVNGPPANGGAVAAGTPMLIGSFIDTLALRDERWFIAERRGGVEMKFG